MSCVVKSLGKQINLSNGVLDLIMKSWSEGTTKQYAPHLKRRFSFCSENWVDILDVDVTSGAKYLTQYFRKSCYEYSSVNTARSVLSSILPAVSLLLKISCHKHFGFSLFTKIYSCVTQSTLQINQPSGSCLL